VPQLGKLQTRDTVCWAKDVTYTVEWLSVQFRYSHFLYSFQSVASGLRRPFPIADAGGHAAIFVVNAALVASQ